MKTRGFEVVKDEFRMYPNEEITLPTRSDAGSAGYDFYVPVDIAIASGWSRQIATDVKAYMLEDEVLEVHIRSSLGIKEGCVLKNGTGIIDSTYYSNESNDGNIIICIKNTSDQTVFLKAGERIAQGLFKKYLVADNDTVINAKRKGGIGSSGK